MPECGEFTTCDNANLSIEDLLRLLIKTDTNGCPAIKTISEQSVPVILYSQNFDEVELPDLPTGWTEPLTSNYWGTGEQGSVGPNPTIYIVPSSGYLNASGNYYLYFFPDAAIDYSEIILSNSISTIGKTNIVVAFGQARTLGTTDLTLAYSTNGIAYTNVPFTNSIDDGNWELITIPLPVGANNQANLRLKLFSVGDTGSSINAIDDFTIYGT